MDTTKSFTHITLQNIYTSRKAINIETAICLRDSMQSKPNGKYFILINLKTYEKKKPKSL